MTINPNIFTFVISKILYIWDYLDHITIGGLFSLLDLGIVIVLAGIVFPAVFNLVTNASMSATADFRKGG